MGGFGVDDDFGTIRENGDLSMESSLEVATVRDVCRSLGVTNQTVYKLLDEKKLRGFRISGRWRVYKESVDAYVGARTETAFELLLKEIFSGDEDYYIQILDQQYKQGLSRGNISSRLGVAEEEVYRWTVTALSTLIPILKSRLSFSDVREDSFALRVIAEIFLAPRS